MIIVSCPHCLQLIEVIELNCKIFRCGILKQNYQQIPPHLNEIECCKLIQFNLIFGCGLPFRVVEKPNNEYCTEKCDYI